MRSPLRSRVHLTWAVVIIIVVTVLVLVLVPEVRSSLNTNLLAEALGVFLAAFLGWFVGMRLRRWEQQQQERTEEKGRTERALRYLHVLRQEVKDLNPTIGPSIEALTEKEGDAYFGSGLHCGTSCRQAESCQE